MAINYQLHKVIQTLPEPHMWEWSELVVRTFLTTFAKYIPAGDAVDLGANIGKHSWTLGEIVKRTNNTLISVEPDPRNYQIIERYIQSSNWFKMEIIKQPISDTNKDVYFFKDDVTELNRIVTEKQYNSVIMTSVTLDDISKGYQPKFIKVDVEGQEINVVKGGQLTIIKNRPIIATEYGPRLYSQEDKKWYYDFFKNQNYIFLDLFGNEFTEDEWLNHHQRYWNRFLIPEEYSYIIPTFKSNLNVLYSLFNLDDYEDFLAKDVEDL